jgi:hypothetical protein
MSRDNDSTKVTRPKQHEMIREGTADYRVDA